MVKMFVSDLDGTVLMQGETQVKRDLLKLITDLKREGKDFVVASGRSYGALKRFFPNHLLDMYFVCENGALIQYQGKTLHKQIIDKKIVSRMIGDIEASGGEWVAAGTHTIYTGNQCMRIAEIYKELNIPVMKVRAVREIPEGIVRISILHTEKCTGTKAKELVRGIDNVIKMSYQDETWTDMVDSMVDKGMALKKLMALKSIDREEIAVFGDNTNDIEMMAVTPNSYAMRWAPEELKIVSNYETNCVLKSIEEMR